MFRFLSPLAGSAARRASLAGLVALAPLAATAQTITGFSPSYGTIGSSVVITGTGLGTTTSVLINGDRMPVTAVSAGSITVKVPSTASNGIIRVTTPTGTATTSRAYRVMRLSTSLAFSATAAVSGAGTAGDFATPCLADLDNDGLLDLIVGFGIFNNTSGTAGTLQRYEQATAADGNFTSSAATSPRTLTVGPAATAASNPAITVTNFAKPFITDLDGDGLLDMLVGENDGRVYLYEQNSLTTPTNFAAPVLLFANPAGNNTRFYARPTVVDLDGNGLLDVLVGANDGLIMRYEQLTANATTTATFSAGSYLQDVSGGTALNLDGGSVSKAQVLDIEGDGLLDLLVGNSDGNLLHYRQSALNAVSFVRVGTGNFNGIALGANQYAAPVMADVNGDGLMDLLVGNYNVAANVAGGNAAGANALRYVQANNNTPTPLPVTLSAFSGQTGKTGALLRWSTAQELNSASFVVERATDSRTFVAVGEVKAAGTSTAPHAYQFLDASAEAQAAAVCYYRLRQLDTDGTAHLSPVVVLARTTAALTAPAAYPNPFTDELYVALPAGSEPQSARLTLTTLSGQTVYAAQLPLSATPQRLAGLPTLQPGLYVLRLTTAAGTTTQRLSHR